VKHLFIGCILVAVTATACYAKDPKSNKEATCRLIEQAARSNRVSVAVLTRLLWTESRFQFDAISPAGAQGVAQFMPATAEERGLSNPFDPVQAVPQAARFVSDLDRRFGNIGVALAAYNAGPGRIEHWLHKAGALPRETSLFVLAITGRTPEEWAALGQYMRLPRSAEAQSCMELRSAMHFDRLNEERPGLVRGIHSALPGFEQSGRMLSFMQQSGRVLPGMEQSGRVLPSVENSGGLLR
jgi:membrane-bound lytic murein transglycosylase MltF